MSNEYSVCLIMDASNNYTIEAETPDEAAKKAEELQWERGVSLCHQCSGEVDLGDTVGAIVFQDDKMVLDTTHSAQWISCLKSERDAMAAELQALKAQMAGKEPAGWQARFTSSGDNRDVWQPCSKEHFELVKRCPAEWPGYEVREVFAAPPAAQDVSGLVEALELSLRRWASWSKEIATTPELEEQQLEIAKCRRVLDAHRQAQQQDG